MKKILKHWSKEEIIKALQKLPKDRIINNKTIIEYSKEGLICDSSLIARKFGSLKNACKQADIRCDALYGKDKLEYMKKINTRWNKENVSIVLKKTVKDYNIKKIKEYGPIAKTSKDIPSQDVIRRYYHSMKNAFKENNIQYDSYY